MKGKRKEEKEKTESKSFVFSAGASSSGCLLEPSGPSRRTHTD